MISNITWSINGIAVSVAPGTSILSAAQQAGLKSLPAITRSRCQTNCRICVVESGVCQFAAGLCHTGSGHGSNHYRPGFDPENHFELILARHPQDCLQCMRNGNCELQNLTSAYDLRQTAFKGTQVIAGDFSVRPSFGDLINAFCGRCTEVCSSTQTVHALGLAYRGYDALVVPSLGQDLLASPCVMCGPSPVR